MYGMVSSHSSSAGRSVPTRTNIRRLPPMDQHRPSVAAASPPANAHPSSVYRRLVNLVKQAWSGVKLALDSDVEAYDVDDSPRPARTRGLEALCSATKFSRSELQRLYRGFKQECPTGFVDQTALAEVYARFFPQGADVSQYAFFVFKTFDREHSGEITFEEFAVGLSLLLRGSCVDRLRWAFGLYDLNGDGCITRDEMAAVIASVYGLLGPTTHPRMEDNTVRDHVDRVFQKLDMNQDGVVTIEEFVEFCSKDEDVARSLDAFDSVW